MPFPEHVIEQLIAALRPSIITQTEAHSVSATLDQHSVSNLALAQLSIEQLGRAPVYIGVAFWVLINIFYFSSLLRWGTRFSRLSPRRRFAHALNWKESPIKLQRDFINFFESFIVLGLYEHYQPHASATGACTEPSAADDSRRDGRSQ